MTYQTTVTQKGQITIPKALRDILKLNVYRRVIVELEPNKKSINLKAAPDFLEIAKKIKIRKKLDPVKAREFMEKNYERV